MTQTLLALLRGDVETISRWLQARGGSRSAICGAAILLGCGLYGCTVGLWRSPLQSLYTSIKFPLLIFLTCAGNALLNGILAQLFAARLTFRQTSLAILLSFAIAAVLLGALSPVALFILYNTPPLASAHALTGHSITLLLHVGLIAYAGIIANRSLFRLLVKMSGSRKTARHVLLSWLGGNLLLGGQLAWILRPFIGSPALVVEFLRPDPLRGNIYEAVFRAASRLLH